MSPQHWKPATELRESLLKLDGEPYVCIRTLHGRRFSLGSRGSLTFAHIQGSPGAMPASVIEVDLPLDELRVPEWVLESEPDRIAAADYLARILHEGVKSHTKPNRGSDGSGSFQHGPLPQQVLARNQFKFDSGSLKAWIRISLPGGNPPKFLGQAAAEMLCDELPLLLEQWAAAFAEPSSLRAHCDAVCDASWLGSKLDQLGLAAFIPDGAILARASGVSDLPLPAGRAVPLSAPEPFAVEIDFPRSGRRRGLGIPKGITVIIGGGYHGKSTLLNALVKAVYPHPPGDGRELAATDRNAILLTAEDGRSVRGVDISAFLSRLPAGVETSAFFTDNASGSTSQAASLVEFLAAGATTLLIDEDSSATNFLIRDEVMRRVVPEDPITPLLDHVRSIHRTHGVSFIMVVGSSSGYLAAADHIICMRNYLPHDLTSEARMAGLPPLPVAPPASPPFRDKRTVLPESFDPSYNAERVGKTILERVKPLRGQPCILEYGNGQLDLRALAALVDEEQVNAIGRALLAAFREPARWLSDGASPASLANALGAALAAGALRDWAGENRLFLALPRKLEIAAAINRLRALKLAVP